MAVFIVLQLLLRFVLCCLCVVLLNCCLWIYFVCFPSGVLLSVFCSFEVLLFSECFSCFCYSLVV